MGLRALYFYVGAFIMGGANNCALLFLSRLLALRRQYSNIRPLLAANSFLHFCDKRLLAARIGNLPTA